MTGQWSTCASACASLSPDVGTEAFMEWCLEALPAVRDYSVGNYSAEDAAG